MRLLDQPSPSVFQTRHDNRSILDHVRIGTFTLHHKVSRQAEPAIGTLRHIRPAVGGGGDNFRVVGDDGNVVPTGHQLAVLTGLARDVGLEDFHHVLFGVGGLGRGPVAIGGDIKRFVVAVKQLDDIGWRRGVDDWGSNELVHGLVIGGLSGIVDKASAADIDSAGEEGHAKRSLVGDALQSADEVGPFEILVSRCQSEFNT